MNDLKNFVQEQINEFAKKYEGSLMVDELVIFKSKADLFVTRRTQAIREFFKSVATIDRTSFILNHGKLSMRLIFYKSGAMHLHLEYSDSLNKFMNDNNVMSKFALDVGHVYFIESEFGWKIGKTKNLKMRKDIFNVKLPFPFALRYHIRTHEKTKLEKQFHEYFKDFQINGEWFLITKEQIIEYVSQYPSLRLSGYSADDKIFIERNYLDKIHSFNAKEIS